MTKNKCKNCGLLLKDKYGVVIDGVYEFGLDAWCSKKCYDVISEVRSKFGTRKE